MGPGPRPRLAPAVARRTRTQRKTGRASAPRAARLTRGWRAPAPNPRPRLAPATAWRNATMYRERGEPQRHESPVSYAAEN
eukprot:2167824-Lingulodinium_polyedra.AAC.1